VKCSQNLLPGSKPAHLPIQVQIKFFREPVAGESIHLQIMAISHEKETEYAGKGCLGYEKW